MEIDDTDRERGREERNEGAREGKTERGGGRERGGGGRERRREGENVVTRNYLIDLLIRLCHDAQLSKNIDEFFVHMFRVLIENVSQHVYCFSCLLGVVVELVAEYINR